MLSIPVPHLHRSSTSQSPAETTTATTTTAAAAAATTTTITTTINLRARTSVDDQNTPDVPPTTALTTTTTRIQRCGLGPSQSCLRSNIYLTQRPGTCAFPRMPLSVSLYTQNVTDPPGDINFEEDFYF
nr:unnamed protein product [Spirometra erinaceieuropaei]